MCPDFLYPTNILPPIGHDPIQSKLFLLTGAQAPFVRFANISAIEPINITSCVIFGVDHGYDGHDCAIDTPSFLRRLLTVSQLARAPAALGSKSRVFLFDIGSSFYRSWHEQLFDGGKWLVDNFERRNITFDRIFGFELQIMDPKTFWLQIPEHLMSVYTLINVGVTAEINSRFNPLTLLRQVVFSHDYVVLKLDIDNPGIETDLMTQIETSYTDLIDELFFEHHVDTPPMRPFWSYVLTDTMTDSYSMFLKLRNKGVRAHSWP